MEETVLLAEIVAADQFKTYDELKKRLENVLRVASSRHPIQKSLKKRQLVDQWENLKT